MPSSHAPRDAHSCHPCHILPAGVGGKKGSVEKCPLCKGRGMQIHIQQIGPGMVQQIQTVCIECKGQGERIHPKDRCESCSGAKVIREKKIIEVHVERGEAMHTGVGARVVPGVCFSERWLIERCAVPQA